MHLGHLLERRWPPYAKWLGTSFARLPRAGVVGSGPCRQPLAATDWRERESGLVEALRVLSRVQADAGLPTVDDPVEPFWDRPYQGVRDAAVIAVLEAASRDPAVRALPRGVGLGGAVERQRRRADAPRSPPAHGIERGRAGVVSPHRRSIIGSTMRQVTAPRSANSGRSNSRPSRTCATWTAARTASTCVT